MPQSDVKIQPVVSTAKEHKYKWKFITEDNAPRHWFAKEFDDSLWPKGTAAFGKSSLWNTQGLISTPWTTPQIYMRRWFYLGDVTQEMLDCMRFMIYHDDDIFIYINGVWAATKKRFCFQLHSLRHLRRSTPDPQAEQLEPNSREMCTRQRRANRRRGHLGVFSHRFPL